MGVKKWTYVTLLTIKLLKSRTIQKIIKIRWPTSLKSRLKMPGNNLESYILPLRKKSALENLVTATIKD